MKPQRIVGLDLSLTATGVAAVDLAERNVRFVLVKSPAEGDEISDTVARINTAVDRIKGAFTREPTLVIIEAPSLGSRFGKPHERAGLWWKVVDWACAEGHIVVQVRPRSRAKYIAGHRPVAAPRKGPDKREVVSASREEFPAFRALANDNVADAFGLARIGARASGSPIDSSTPQRVEVVAAVRWPHEITK